jgi:putative membrane protein
MMLSRADHNRVHDAIEAAEEQTSGEIFCVVAKESGSYREVPFAWAAAAALIGPPLALVFGMRPSLSVLFMPQSGWAVAEAGALRDDLSTALIAYAVMQALVFVIALLIFSIPLVRRALTPGALKRGHVHARAMEQFMHRLHTTSAHTGVLIFASLAERRVEVIADEAIHVKVGDAPWNEAVARATAMLRKGDAAGGLAAAIAVCGQALAKDFPPVAGEAPGGDRELVDI